MPVKARIAKDRRPSFSAEVVALFLELERMSHRGPKFEAGSRKLAIMLGLTDEFWTCNHVNDRSSGPCHPPNYAAHDDWYTCRRVREQLLAVVGERRKADA